MDTYHLIVRSPAFCVESVYTDAAEATRDLAEILAASDEPTQATLSRTRLGRRRPLDSWPPLLSASTTKHGFGVQP